MVVLARLATVFPSTVARIHRADRHPVLGRHHLDLHFVRVAAVSALHGIDLDVARTRHGVDITVYALDLDRLAGGDLSLPMEVTLSDDRPCRERETGRDERQRDDAHGHSSSWS